MKLDCIFHKHCEAPLCPMQSREENKKAYWFTYEPICMLKNDIPSWVKQQRKIAHQIKARNQDTVFELVMLEAPFRVTSNVKGIEPDEDICRNCQIIEWFLENLLPIPEEIEINHHEEEMNDGGKKVDQTIQ